MKTITYKITKVMRAIVASLIILTALPGISKGENSGREAVEITANELTVQVKSWMNDNSYWSDVDNSQSEENSATTVQSENEDLSNKMESWISNGTLWNGDSEEQELALQMKMWISNNTYWNNDTEENNQELALQMKSWISNISFWNRRMGHVSHITILAIK
jgi:hypothetical protein